MLFLVSIYKNIIKKNIEIIADNKVQTNKNIEITTDTKSEINENVYTVSDNEIEKKIYSLDEIESMMIELDTKKHNIEHICESESITEKTFVNKTIQLTNEYKYAQVFYLNNSSKTVDLIIPEADIMVSVPSYKGISHIWTKGEINEKTYTISISSDGSENLNGKISIAKLNVKNEIK